MSGPTKRDPAMVAATGVAALSCAAIILLVPSVAAVGTFERLGLQITSICGLLAVGYVLGGAAPS